MAVHGYITHAAHNRRWTAWLVLGYILAFELIGAFAATMVLLKWDHEHTIISNPLGYAVRYAVPIAIVAGLIFWRMYRGHAKAVTRELGVRIVTRQDEPRFVQIAEEQCTALGVRLPRFGIIETSEPNAVTVGEGPNRGLIAVTRGLLERLDDDELAAVLAHEASHIRLGDTKLLAANHALMRTAVIMQMNNPLRFESWRQMLVPLIFPPFMLVMLASSAVTAMSMQLARVARRGLKLGRDYIADGEAIRVTHFPEALISAIAKIGGRGAFEGSYRVEAMLFDGIADHAEGSHPTARDRIDAIAELGGELMNPARQRRDTRTLAAPAFGRRGRMAAMTYPGMLAAIAYPRDAQGKPLEQPQRPAQNLLLMYFNDREAFRRWHDAAIAWTEWELRERRNILGLTSKLMIPLALTWAALLFIYWPKDGNLSKLMNVFNPAQVVELGRAMNSGPACYGPSYPDGCKGANGATMVQLDSPKQVGAPAANVVAPAERKAPASGTFNNSSAAQGYDPDWQSPNILQVLLIAFGIMLFRKPDLLRKILGSFETPTTDLSEFRRFDADEANKSATPSQPTWNAAEPVRHAPPPGPASFGRRK
ncbi:M48 family metalloprotease [Afipia sp. GAS231]|uniref:M48 family metalloprotease n=1 Tax=Afipia sp. GAS231 TaxID=1882747 RepID=UPI000879A60E|nr:M48 family metalloprotease [Afipia sp. GAS231]SDO71513.1 Zn-dependent protease with chaperone function [Afipia sp. GAS231]